MFRNQIQSLGWAVQTPETQEGEAILSFVTR
jgi:hypothetical protein